MIFQKIAHTIEYIRTKIIREKFSKSREITKYATCSWPKITPGHISQNPRDSAQREHTKMLKTSSDL